MKPNLFTFDVRRRIAFLPNEKEAIEFAVDHFLRLAREAIEKRGAFYVALSGGSTPKAIYALLAQKGQEAIDWSKVHIYFSDERALPPTSKDNNYRMAMDAGISQLPIPKEQIHRMVAEQDIEENALAYERLVQQIPGLSFDLLMLGMGDDGHTASLFPKTHGLHAEERFIVANFLPEKNVWRMTVTFDCIHHAKAVVVYVLGAAKSAMLKQVLYGPYEPDLLPIQRVGSEATPALFVVDRASAGSNFETNHNLNTL